MKKQKLILMVGESGSGKSTLAKSMLDKFTVRVNRDTIRKMLFQTWNAKFEKLVETIEFDSAESALKEGYNVIVDDLNINPKTRQQWEDFAQRLDVEFEVREVVEPLEACVQRDRQRDGRDRVGQSVITKQFIRNNRKDVFQNVPTVIVDVDGTLADCTDVRSPFDESRVSEDKVYREIAHQVRQLWNKIDKHQIIIVSGRHETCGPDTEDWLLSNVIPFDGLLMRNRGDNRDDRVVKKELLDLILKYVDKNNIKLVIDDRPKVIRMWRENGLTVQAARGEDIEEF